MKSPTSINLFSKILFIVLQNTNIKIIGDRKKREKLKTPTLFSPAVLKEKKNFLHSLLRVIGYDLNS